MQDGSNRYGWDGKVEIRARVIRTGKQDGTLKGRQAGRQAGRELGRAEGCRIRHEENYDRGKGATL